MTLAVSPLEVRAERLVGSRTVVILGSFPQGKPYEPPKPEVKLTLKTGRFPRGWCTWYVAQKRAEMGKPITWSGNAGSWATNAKRQGYAVSTTPQVGAIYVSTVENSRSCRGCGHVALVVEVRASTIVLSEMNYAGFNRISTRVVPKTILARYIL